MHDEYIYNFKKQVTLTHCLFIHSFWILWFWRGPPLGAIKGIGTNRSSCHTPETPRRHPWLGNSTKETQTRLHSPTKEPSMWILENSWIIIHRITIWTYCLIWKIFLWNLFEIYWILTKKNVYSFILSCVTCLHVDVVTNFSKFTQLHKVFDILECFT